MPDIISQSNTAEVGDGVVTVLPFASPPVALILTRGFELQLGIKPPKWNPASEQLQGLDERRDGRIELAASLDSCMEQ